MTNDISKIPFYNVNDGKQQVDAFGFAVVEKGAKPRPRPQPATLGMYLSNAFRALSCPDEQEEEGAKLETLSRPTRPDTRPDLRVQKLLEWPGTPNATATGSGCIEHPADEPTLGETHDWLPLQLCDAMFPALSREVHREIMDVEKILLMEETANINDELNTLRDTTTIKVAMDSGACRHVAHPRTMPAGVKTTHHSSGAHFSGAGGETIERFGDATTLGTLKNSAQVVNKWNLADVVRPLHSVAEIIGPADHPKGNYDVLFNNRRCVVVEAGVVEHIMQHLQAVSEYSREGNLYTAEMVLSPFGGPDFKA